MITNLLNPGDIDNNTFFVLLNTLYFKSTWYEQFDSNSTKLKTFYGISSNRNENMMHHFEVSFKYYESPNVQVLSLPYKTPKFTFCVVLPKDKKSKPPILNSEELKAYIENMKYESVNVTLPKFTQETELDLVPFFKSLGVSKMFEDIDILNITDNTNITNKKYISVFKQKVKIIVDENGTEASAATVVSCLIESCCFNECKVIDFVANHPFTYYIMYDNIILFSGTYM